MPRGFGVGDAHRDPGLGYLQVGGPDYPDVMMRALRLKGQLPELVLPAMQVGFTLDDFTRPEYWWLRRGYLAMSGGVGAAGVGNGSFGQLIIQPGRIAVVEAFWAQAAVASRFAFTLGGGLAGGGANSIFTRDGRSLSISYSSAFQTGNNVGVPPGGAVIIAAPANTPAYFPGPLVVTGGAIALCQCFTLNQACDFGCIWRERDILPEEL